MAKFKMCTFLQTRPRALYYILKIIYVILNLYTLHFTDKMMDFRLCTVGISVSAHLEHHHSEEVRDPWKVNHIFSFVWLFMILCLRMLECIETGKACPPNRLSTTQCPNGRVILSKAPLKREHQLVLQHIP